MKKQKKQVEFSKMLDLEKIDISNLTHENMVNIIGGKLVPLPTKDTMCENTNIASCDTYSCDTCGQTYSCVCSQDTCVTHYASYCPTLNACV